MTHYAILGGGRLARHMRHYLTLSGLPVSIWSRDGTLDVNTHNAPNARVRLEATVRPASHVLLLVSDGAIADLVSRYPFLHQKTLLHCSGALSIPGVAGAHPLMTFGHELYTLGQYQKIPFMVDQGHDFAALLPGLCNPHFPVRLEDKPRYHALCVMAGNFSQILWQAASAGFESMGLPPETLAPYLQQVVSNFIANPAHTPFAALTGPLSRGDVNTIRRNLSALNGDPLQPVYQAFVDLYRDSQAAEGPQEVAL
jgi:2-dehydropantoate 2-reductase